MGSVVIELLNSTHPNRNIKMPPKSSDKAAKKAVKAQKDVATAGKRGRKPGQKGKKRKESYGAHVQPSPNGGWRVGEHNLHRLGRCGIHHLQSHDDTSGTSRSIEGKDSLDGNIHGWHVEGFEHDLGHLFTVSLWVKWGFSQENGLFFWCNTEFVVEGVMPDLFHIIPVGDDSVFNWVFQGKDTSLGLGFITYIGIFLTHTNHDTLVSWASNNGWEYG